MVSDPVLLAWLSALACCGVCILPLAFIGVLYLLLRINAEVSKIDDYIKTEA